MTCVYAAPRSSLYSCGHNMRRQLRCHRLLAYDIACRPIAGPTILVPSPRHLSQKQKFAAPCTYGEFSDAKRNVGVLLVAVLGCATYLVSSYLATKVITAAYICRSTLSCGPEVHEAVYRYTYNVDLTTPNASSSYRIYNIHSTFELPVSTCRLRHGANTNVAYASHCSYLVGHHALALGRTSSLRLRRISVLLNLL